MSHLPELKRLRLKKLNVLSELQRIDEREQVLRAGVSALEKLESICNEELGSKIVISILEEKLKSAPSRLQQESFEWSASPAKVKELYLA